MLFVKANHTASPNSRRWRNRLHLWVGEMAKSHCKGVYIVEWEEIAAIKPFTTGARAEAGNRKLLK